MPQTLVSGSLTSNDPGAPIRFDAPELLLADGLYNAFPMMARRSSDGLLALGYRQGISHVGDDDAGRAVLRLSSSWPTFGSEIEVWAEPEYDIRCCQPMWAVNGDLLVAWWKRVPGSVTIVNGCRFQRSTDGGATFSAPVAINDGLTGFSACEGPPVELPNGDLLLPVYGEGLDPGDDQRSSVLMVSSDGGATWTRRATIADGQTDGRDYNEPNIILIGTTLVCLARPHKDPDNGNQFVFRSTDDGMTWTPVTSFPGTGAPHLANIDGNILATYRSAGSPLNKNVARLSRDLGTTWTDQYQVPGTNNCMYFTTVQSGLAAFRGVYAYSFGDPANLKYITGVAA